MTAAERKRRERKKRRAGIVGTVLIDVDFDDMDAFNDAGLIEWNSDDRDEIAQAVRAALNDWRGGHA